MVGRGSYPKKFWFQVSELSIIYPEWSYTVWTIFDTIFLGQPLWICIYNKTGNTHMWYVTYVHNHEIINKTYETCVVPRWDCPPQMETLHIYGNLWMVGIIFITWFWCPLKVTNVNPGFCYLPGLFDWEGTILVAIITMWRDPPRLINQAWHSCGVDINFAISH